MAALLLAAACQEPPEPDRLAALREIEDSERASTDFSTASPPALGSDPYRIVELDAERAVGILRGDHALVLLDRELSEIARVPAPKGTSALAVQSGRIFVGGGLSSRIASFEARGRSLIGTGSIELGPEVRGVRALAAGPGRLYALDELGGRLIALDPARPESRRSLPIGSRPIEIARAGAHVIVSCLVDHSVAVVALDDDGWPLDAPRRRIVHDGPIWGFDAKLSEGTLLLALGGVENHPLDRSIGSFGYIDSFVDLYRLAPGREAELLSSVNVSEHGVITPKALRFADAAAPELEVWGYGGDRRARIAWPRDAGPPRVTTSAAPPGVAFVTAGTERRLGASPLFDAWVVSDARGVRLVPVPNQPPRHELSRLGEALFFTRLMAPANRSDGALSRFTCETCHFEGTVDGRVHHTGRGNVRVATRSLTGLFVNRPYFSRALDRTAAKMVDNEFRVAGAGSGTDPWFSASTADFPWLSELGVREPALGPETLRAALLRFFIDFEHGPNPRAFGRSGYSALERRGAELFRDRCERCHAARVVTDDAASRVSFEGWEAAIFARGGPIVWAQDRYERTGIEPTVHELGARVPSLRRLELEGRYFTDGSARSLDDVLSRARFAGERFLHAGEARALERFDAGERAALRAFLELL